MNITVGFQFMDPRLREFGKFRQIHRIRHLLKSAEDPFTVVRAVGAERFLLTPQQFCEFFIDERNLHRERKMSRFI